MGVKAPLFVLSPGGRGTARQNLKRRMDEGSPFIHRVTNVAVRAFDGFKS